MTYGYFVYAQDIPSVEMYKGVTRLTLGTTDEAMLCRVEFKAGSVLPPHQHMNDQVGYVIEGEVEITIADETRILQRGDSYAIPGGVTHQVKALQDSMTIDTFSPPRDDYRIDAV